MNQDILITVIMPAYNSGRFIKDSIQSVLSQSYQNLELLVVDDASSDNTKEIVESFSDSRIIYMKNDVNRGVGYSRNIAAKSASGAYLAFLDSDDIWEKDKLECQIDLMLSTYCKFSFTGSGFMNEKGERKEFILNVPDKITLEEIYKQNIISCSSVLIEKELYLRHMMSEDRGLLHEDFLSWIDVLKEVGYARGINKPLLIYRLYDSSKSANKIKAFRMNWNTLRKSGLPVFKAIKEMMFYSINGLKKYTSLYKD